MVRFTRRQLAQYAALQLLQGKSEVITELAAYLVQAKRTQEADLLVLDIETELLREGVAVAEVTSVHALDADTREKVTSAVRTRLGAKEVYMREVIDASLLGGVRVGVADEELDASVKRSINELKAMKI
jgi:F-type H+-transporting ATPase subunit delta